MKKLFHGSEKIIKKPVYGQGRTDNDYGQGFYCTEDIELAREWAALDERGGFVNSYSFNERGMRIMDLTMPEYSVLSWMALLLKNRNVRLSSPLEKRAREFLIRQYLPDTKKADVIVGYKADDSYFSFARAFLSNTITIDQLSTALSLGDLGLQYMIKSERAFQALHYDSVEPVDGMTYYPRRIARDRSARDRYMQLLEDADKHGRYINDIMKGEGR